MRVHAGFILVSVGDKELLRSDVTGTQLQDAFINAGIDTYCRSFNAGIDTYSSAFALKWTELLLEHGSSMTFCGLVFTRNNYAIAKDGFGLVHKQAIEIIRDTFQRNWVQAITLRKNSLADTVLFEQFKNGISSASIQPGNENDILSSMKSTAQRYSSKTFVATRAGNDDIPHGHGVCTHRGRDTYLVHPGSATEVVKKELDATHAIIKHCFPDKDNNFIHQTVAEILCTADVPSSNTCSVWECDTDVIDNNHGNTTCQKHRKCYKCTTTAVRGKSDMCQKCTTKARNERAEVTDDPDFCCTVGCPNVTVNRQKKCFKCKGWR